MRPADPIPALSLSETRGPAGWRIAMVFCHVLMGLTFGVAAFYVLLQTKAFDLF
jgi:hypothetical protein